VDPYEAFELRIAQHVNERDWLGNGSSAIVFLPDLLPLTPEDCEIFARRVEALYVELAELVSDLPESQRVAEPAGNGRSIEAILQHTLESNYVYMRCGLGKDSPLEALIKQAERGTADWGSVLERTGERIAVRLRETSEEERTQVVQRGKEVWTARTGVRCILEHGWQRLREISSRLDGGS
jgi:uncharacterized damage-inducible protein DinB